MSLSPSDVEEKAFTQALRGYQMDEVDDFLDEVVGTLKAHEQRLREAQDRIRSLESDVGTRGGDESTISRAFIAAQRSADALIVEAEEQAAKIRREAESEAALLMSERDAQRKGLLAEIGSMRGAVAALRERLSELAGQVSDEVEMMEATVAHSEAEVREPDPSEEVESPEPAAESEEATEESAEPAPAKSMVGELPSLDLTEEPASRVSARPWERG
jgi:cell division initiation protein